MHRIIRIGERYMLSLLKLIRALNPVGAQGKPSGVADARISRPS